MFYVIYNSATKQYVNDEEGLGSYENAAQFQFHADAAWALSSLVHDMPPGLKIVGPCVEGETP